MSMDAFISGSVRSIRRVEAFIGGNARSVSRAEAYINGQWRTVLSFTTPMSLTVNPSSVNGIRSTPRPSSGVVTTNTTTATPSGGTAPYSYFWQVIEGTAQPTIQTNASTAFQATLTANSEREAVARVTCTDARGQTATATVSLFFTNQSDI